MAYVIGYNTYIILLYTSACTIIVDFLFSYIKWNEIRFGRYCSPYTCNNRDTEHPAVTAGIDWVVAGGETLLS